MLRKWLRIELLAVLAAAGILFWLLMMKPVIGLADNGDFLRIMNTVGLDYLNPTLSYEDKYFGRFIREWDMKELGLGGYVSTSLVPVYLAKGISWLLNGGLFDMRFLAFVYGLLFLWGMYLFLRSNQANKGWVNVLPAALFVFMFADVGYAAYYNSLFSEPAAYVFWLITLGFAAGLTRSTRPSMLMLTGFMISAVFLIGAKVQNAPIGILFTLLCLRFAFLRGGLQWKRRTRIYSLILVAASIGIYFSLPKEIRIINEYQTVFFGVLKGSPTPEADLREMGFPEKLAVNAGTNYFEQAPIDQKDPIIMEEFHPEFSHMKVALFYLKHPARFFEKMEIAAQHGLTIRPYYLGNYEESAGKSYGAVSFAYSGWSEFKRKVLPNELWFISLVFAVFFAVFVRRYLATYRVREQVYLELWGIVGLAGLFQFITPIIGDGEADLAKHLFGFNVCFDLMLWVLVYWFLQSVAKAKRR